MANSDPPLSKTNQMQCKLCHKTFPAGSGWLCPDDNATLVPVESDPLIGIFLDKKYEMLECIGEGGMSVVYKARHRYMDRLVAVKLLKQNLIGDPLAGKRFQQESKAASSLTHQNIISVHDFGFTDGGQAYFVMDYVDGESLSHLLERETRLSLTQAVEIFRQICDGLEEAHRVGLIHRDLKPSNIVLLKSETGDLHVKIVDFGIAKFLPREDDQKRMRLTQTGEIFGSPLYMSPEQCQGQALDARSDIYSLGCLMYESLAGVPPFSGDNFVTLAVKHINQLPPSFEENAPAVRIPENISSVVLKCLEKNPADRFQSIEQLRQAMLDAALLCGVEGVRSGGVPAGGKPLPSDSLNNKVKISLSHKLAPQGKSSFSFVRLLVYGVPAVFIATTIAFLFFWQGPSGDHGSPMAKLRWQLDMYFAQQAMAAKNYDQARRLLLDGVATTEKFGDRQERLRLTLVQLADAYGRCGSFADQEKTIQHVHEIEEKQNLSDAETLSEKLNQLSASSSSSVQLTENQLEAQAIARDITDLAGRLLSNGRLGRDEALLRQALLTYKRLGMAQRAEVADFDIALANCLHASQRLSEIRPLLVDALEIRRATRIDASTQSTHKLIRALLRLGQFDRDQSHFDAARVELAEALQLTEHHFGSENTLMSECLNSYADLMRQMGCQEDFERYDKQARAIGSRS